MNSSNSWRVSNMSSCPKLRIEGFTDAWEQRKLGQVSVRVQGNDGEMGLPTLTISASEGWMKQEDRFSRNIAGKEQKNYTLLHKGELSYNHGNSKLAKYGSKAFEIDSNLKNGLNIYEGKITNQEVINAQM